MSNEQKAHDLTLAYISFMSSIKSEGMSQDDFYQDYENNLRIFQEIIKANS